jgi:plasmid stabilization system protein ParE
MNPLSFTPLARQDLQEIHDYINDLIFYRDYHDRLEIMRVLHGARDIESLFTE